ncbi:hypothetical protein VTN00DRAFT_10192 [Thermoascus crustaceus]|uniref:uncharacterized protein n=1 Tax=Thermoascus crustaceus TaxID=5088 RepID=UPI0037425E25
MIPPCDPAVLENNPQFKRLHQHLTTNLLKPDGSTRANDSDPARRAVQEELKAYQIRHAKAKIKKRAIGELAFDLRNGLPEELRDLVAVIALYLESSTPPFNERDNSNNDSRDGEEMLSLLYPDIDEFHSNIRLIAPSLSNQLVSTVDSLRKIANATTEDSAPTRSSSSIPTLADRPRTRPTTITRQSTIKINQPSLSSQLGNRLRTLHEVQTSELPAARRQMAATAAEVLAVRAEIMERTVELLERTKHGALARAAKARAEHLATVAAGVEGKVRVMKLETLGAIYTPETITALTRYREHLRDTRRQLEEKQKIAIQELETYEAADSGQDGGGGGGNGPMVEIARRYGALVKEIEAVKMEMKRLGH